MKGNLKQLFAFLILCVRGIAFADDYNIISDALNVRQGPGSNHKILGVKYKGDIVDVVEITGNWAKIPYNNSFGYIGLHFIEKQEASTAVMEQSEPQIIVPYKPEPNDQKMVLINVGLILVFLMLLYISNRHKKKNEIIPSPIPIAQTPTLSRTKGTHPKKKNAFVGGWEAQWDKALAQAQKELGTAADPAALNRRATALFEEERNRHKDIHQSTTFNILDESTWNLATDALFQWSGKTFPWSSNKGKPASTATEKDIVNFVGQGLSSFYARAINKFGIENTISYMLDTLITNGDPVTCIQDTIVHLSKNYTTISVEADTDPIRYEGKIIYKQDGTPLSEKEFKTLVKTMEDYLNTGTDNLEERFIMDNRAITVILKKLALSNTLTLNNIDGRGHDLSWLRAENRGAPPAYQVAEQYLLPENAGLFNPRDPNTYKYATNKQLVIDGIKIFNRFKMVETDREGTEKEVKNPLSERAFVQYVDLNEHESHDGWSWSTQWDICVRRAQKQEVDKQKIHTVAQTYYDRMQETGETDITQEEIDELRRENIDREIKELLVSNRKPIKKYGYTFSLPQYEVVKDLPENKLKILAEILKKGAREHWSPWNIKSEIFTRLQIDGEWVASLGVGIPADLEEACMHDYFLGFENLETEEAVNELLDASEYLKDNPVLKAKIRKHLKEYILENEDEESNAIDIQHFTIHDDIKQLLWFGDGPLQNLTKWRS